MVFFIIISDVCPVQIFPYISRLPQVNSIFIWAINEQCHNILDEYNKLNGLYSEFDDLIQRIKESVTFSEVQAQSAYYTYHNQKLIRDLTQESSLFVWFLLLVHIITKFPRNEQAKFDTVKKCVECYGNNHYQLKQIKIFQDTYSANNIIKWYTKQSFVYKLINKALRTEDVEELYAFRFLIAELHLEITHQYEKLKCKNDQTIILYRGCKLFYHELRKMDEDVGKLISMNGFLSTSRSKDIALIFAGTSKKTDIKQSVLFEIECVMRELVDVNTSVVFADIASFSNYIDEEEVLFGLGSTFRIISCNYCQVSSIHIIKLKVSNDGDTLVKEYIDLNNRDFEKMPVEVRFGRLLTDMGQNEKAIRYFQKLLIENPAIDLPLVYFNFARIYHLTGDYENSLRSYEISRKMIEEQQETSSQQILSGSVFNNIGSVFYKKKEYDQALFYFKKGYQLRLKILGISHRDTAQSLNDMGNVYFDTRKYISALYYYEKSFEIRKYLFPIDHAEKAASIHSIALVRWKQNRLDDALEYHLKSLDMLKKVLPPSHDDIAGSLMCIGNVLTEQYKFDKAIDYYTTALHMREILFPNGHPNVALSLYFLGCYFEKKHAYAEAIEYYTKELEMYK
ncbi:unnamed protein product, partial [Rotaria magnacalcarata]